MNENKNLKRKEKRMDKGKKRKFNPKRNTAARLAIRELKMHKKNVPPDGGGASPPGSIWMCRLLGTQKLNLPFPRWW